MNLPLLALCIIILFIIYNLESMRSISSGVAMIEDNDLNANEVQLKQEAIIDFLKESGEDLSRTTVLKIIDVSNTKENEEKYIMPLVKGNLLRRSTRGTSTYYTFNKKK